MILNHPAHPHKTVVIAGGGISGLTALIQLKRQLALDHLHVKLYEMAHEFGGTWSANSYPGAASDIPISLYSLSCNPAKEFDTQWPSSRQILSYWKRTVDKYAVAGSIKYRRQVVSATFSRQTSIWTLEVKDLETDETTLETCNVFVSAVGALSNPADAPFDTTQFEGRVVHTAKWDESIDLEGKRVVVLGNGCSAAQFVPAVIDKVAQLTQIARSKHSIVPPVPVPDNSFTNFLVRWIPGLFTLFRFTVFLLCESYVWMNQDNDKAKKGRQNMKTMSDRYIEKTAPERYWDALKYDFEFGQKRRVIDFKGYTSALHSPRMNLVQPDTIARAVGNTVTTANGVEIRDVDLIVLSIGFKVTDYLFPLKVFNDQGENLGDRLRANGVKTYLSSMVASYPNFFILMGPNSVPNSSSALFNSECTVEMMIKLLRPVIEDIKEKKNEDREGTTAAVVNPLLATEVGVNSPTSPTREETLPSFSRSPFDEKFPFHRTPEPEDTTAVVAAPTVEVTQEAEDEWYASLREEMGKRIWESNKLGRQISWYTDAAQGGKCTTLYPWGQFHFKKATENIVKDRFIWSNC